MIYKNKKFIIYTVIRLSMHETYLVRPLFSAVGLTDNVVSLQREVHVLE